MKLYDELVARGLIAQVTNEEEIREMIDNSRQTHSSTASSLVHLLITTSPLKFYFLFSFRM